MSVGICESWSEPEDNAVGSLRFPVHVVERAPFLSNLVTTVSQTGSTVSYTFLTSLMGRRSFHRNLGCITGHLRRSTFATTLWRRSFASGPHERAVAMATTANAGRWRFAAMQPSCLATCTLQAWHRIGNAHFLSLFRTFFPARPRTVRFRIIFVFPFHTYLFHFLYRAPLPLGVVPCASRKYMGDSHSDKEHMSSLSLSMNNFAINAMKGLVSLKLYQFEQDPICMC